MSDYRLLRVDTDDDALVALVLCAEFDPVSTQQLRDELRRAAADAPGRACLLDLSGVTFMASMTLGTLVELSNGFRSEGRRMVLCGVSPRIRDMMARTAIDGLFEFRNDVATARQELG